MLLWWGRLWRGALQVRSRFGPSADLNLACCSMTNSRSPAAAPRAVWCKPQHEGAVKAHSSFFDTFLWLCMVTQGLGQPPCMSAVRHHQALGRGGRVGLHTQLLLCAAKSLIGRSFNWQRRMTIIPFIGTCIKRPAALQQQTVHGMHAAKLGAAPG